jgi:hypothetical protein
MQPVETPHDREVGGRHRPRQVVHAAAADAQSFRLLRDRQIVLAHDHRLALSKPALPSATSKKSFSSVSSPILAWSDFTSTSGVLASARRRPEHPGSPFLKLRLPLRNLVGMNVEVLRQFSHRVLAPDGGQRHLRLECRCVVPAGSSAHRIS